MGKIEGDCRGRPGGQRSLKKIDLALDASAASNGCNSYEQVGLEPTVCGRAPEGHPEEDLGIGMVGDVQGSGQGVDCVSASAVANCMASRLAEEWVDQPDTGSGLLVDSDNEPRSTQ